MAVAVLWGQASIAHLPRTFVRAAPFSGTWEWHAGRYLLVPTLLAAALVVTLPRLLERLPWPAVVAATAVASAAWTVALAAADGWRAVTEPLASEYEPLALVPFIGSPLEFLRSFTERVVDYPIHVQGHPPGITLLFWVIDGLGLAGAGWATAVVVLALAVSVAAVVGTARLVVGEVFARRAASFLAMAPFAVWGTSTDPVYGAFLGIGTLLIVFATAGGRAASAAAVAGGAVLALTLHLTYGAVPLLLVPAIVVVARRAWRTAAGAVAGALAVTTAFVAGGFWWFEGLAATRELYAAGVASRRPYGYFTFAGNPGALALAVGPATAAGVAVLRDRRAWLLVGAALVAVGAADLSGLSKAEVERIWIPFMPWLLLAPAALATSRRALTGWLAVQAVLALTLQAALQTPW